MSTEVDQAHQAGHVRVARTAYSRDETGFRWMYVVDACTLFILTILITTLRFGQEWPDYSRNAYLVRVTAATTICIAVAYFGGLYDREHRLGNRSQLARVAPVVAVAVLIIATFSLGAGQFLMPRLNLAIFGAVAVVALAFNRWLAESVRTARFGRPKVLLVGNPDDIGLVEAHLAETDRDAVVVGTRSANDLPLDAIEECGATDVLLLSGCELSSIYPEPLGVLETRRIGVYHRLEPSDTLLGLRKTRQIAGVPFVPVRSHALPPSKAHFKRVLDLLYITIAVPLLVPLMLLVTLYAFFVAGRPVFYRQKRIGRYGQDFTMYKFRTMYPDSEAQTGAVLAEKDDPRVMPAMRWMRAMRIDELPQLWNVIKGDMSLVGPRPERPEIAQGFEALIPGYGRRHDMRPGITGLAQVHGGYRTDPGYKLGHDLQYLVNWSPIADLQILLQTIVVVLGRKF